jgi:hypothetical protein
MMCDTNTLLQYCYINQAVNKLVTKVMLHGLFIPKVWQYIVFFVNVGMSSHLNDVITGDLEKLVAIYHVNILL